MLDAMFINAVKGIKNCFMSIWYNKKCLLGYRRAINKGSSVFWKFRKELQLNSWKKIK